MKGRYSLSAESRKLVKKLNDVKDWAKWVSPSDLTNYMLDDPVLDFFKIKSRGTKRSRGDRKIGSGGGFSIGTGFDDYIKNQGIHFEQNIYGGLIESYDNHIVEIEEGTPVEKLTWTLLELEKGTPIIYQGFLADFDYKTFGLPDLIVRSDWVRKLFPGTPIRNPRKRSRFGRFHYVIIDIKWSTLHLRSGQYTLRKHGRINAYKGQLYVYNRAIANIQKYEPEYAFIWGRAWVHESCNIKVKGLGDELLGIVDFTDVDKPIKAKVEKAIEWISELRCDYSEWSLYPPSREELYPNMKNPFNGDFGKQKKELAKKIKEITSLWYCGLKARRRAHAIGITRYDDKKLRAYHMGFEGEREYILDAILRVNQNENFTVLPKIILDNSGDWQTKPEMNDSANVVEFFVDFETIGGFMIDSNSICQSDRVFMIGIGRMAPIGRKGLRTSQTGRWEYKCFTSTTIDSEGEKEIFNQLYDYLESFGTDKTFKLYHWGRAEYNWLTRVCQEHPAEKFCNSYIDDIWINFHEMVATEPVVIKGATNFGLKNMTRALHDLGLINCNWNEECADGMNAMARAFRCYNGGKGARDPRMAIIREYNNTDCKAVYCILNYLRENHVDTTLECRYDDESSEEYDNKKIKLEDGPIPGYCWFCNEACSEGIQTCNSCAKKVEYLSELNLQI